MAAAVNAFVHVTCASSAYRPLRQPFHQRERSVVNRQRQSPSSLIVSAVTPRSPLLHSQFVRTIAPSDETRLLLSPLTEANARKQERHSLTPNPNKWTRWHYCSPRAEAQADPQHDRETSRPFSSPSPSSTTPLASESTSSITAALSSSPLSGPPHSNMVASPQQEYLIQDSQAIEDGNSVIPAGDKNPYNDLARVGAVGVLCSIFVALLQHQWIVDHRDISMVMVFILGYAGIICEELIGFDKTSVSLLMGTAIWTIFMAASGVGSSAGANLVHEHLSHSLAGISEIIFFLAGAMTIVEIVDGHEGFRVVTDSITTRNRKTLLWIIGVVTFFMSSCLDNLTSTIVMISLLRKLISDQKERWLFGAVVVIAANAGGAWTPIGDLTTTLLWVSGNITPVKTMTDLFLPSFISLAASLACFTPMVSGQFQRPEVVNRELPPRAGVVFGTGLAALLSVPVFKAVTGLPPYLGMMSGLGFLWFAVDAIHAGENRDNLRGAEAVKRIDSGSVLFFLGILLAVAGLESAGILSNFALYLDDLIPSRQVVAVIIGLVSAVLDNVPLVQATIGMYNLDQAPVDSALWQLDALCAGIGGSILIIGSASGVALLGLEKVPFGWYLRKVSLPALLGYFASVVIYEAVLRIQPILASTGHA